MGVVSMCEFTNVRMCKKKNDSMTNAPMTKNHMGKYGYFQFRIFFLDS